ncbi:MAG TPA: type VI secretion system baseplate subunit TssF, partial [Planctomycetaceae bacterium]
MDPRLLKYYNRELQHVREMGAEFAEEFPKIAGRLGLEQLECADPYVERLLEGFGFLAARVQLKLDSEFPRFSQHLLEMVYPDYLAPIPSMAVVQFALDPAAGALPDGFRLPRGSAIKSLVGPDDQTACEFRTAHDVTLWPVEVAQAEYLTR